MPDKVKLAFAKRFLKDVPEMKVVPFDTYKRARVIEFMLSETGGDAA